MRGWLLALHASTDVQLVCRTMYNLFFLLKTSSKLMRFSWRSCCVQTRDSSWISTSRACQVVCTSENVAAKKTYLQHLYFSHGYLLDLSVILGFNEFLDRDHLSRFLIAAFADHAIRTLSNHAEILVLLHSEASVSKRAGIFGLALR
jgi:hypothetical protein